LAAMNQGVYALNNASPFANKPHPAYACQSPPGHRLPIRPGILMVARFITIYVDAVGMGGFWRGWRSDARRPPRDARGLYGAREACRAAGCELPRAAAGTCAVSRPQSGRSRLTTTAQFEMFWGKKSW